MGVLNINDITNEFNEKETTLRFNSGIYITKIINSLNIKLSNGQLNYLDTLFNSKKVINLKARQSGGTFVTSLYLIEKLLIDKSKILIISKNTSSSEYIADKLHKLLIKINQGGLRQSIRKIIKDDGYILTTSRIIGTPLKELDIIYMDECAYFVDNDPTIIDLLNANNTQVILSSTPNGLNWFYDTFMYDNNFTQNRLIIEDNPLITDEYLNHLRRSYSEAQFNQEILGDFFIHQ